MEFESLVGTVIAGKYRIERVLGEGGMGVVLSGIHIELDERVAIKLLRREGARNEDVVGRFLREGRAAAKIKSEHIVRVRDVGKLDDATPYMVMEYLDGRDLGATLDADGALPLAFAVDSVLQACDALSEAHAAGIVHRDLKPANLFLTKRRNGTACVKILDFGISKVSGEAASIVKRTAKDDVFGSPLYMSPEQLVSTADVDARSDIYALGVVLFELLTGRSPFDASSLARLHAAILTESALDVRALRPDVPEAVALAIARCLEKDRQRRFPNVAALAEALAPFASAVGAEAVHTIRVATAGAPPAAPVKTSPSVGAGGASAGEVPGASTRAHLTFSSRTEQPGARRGPPSLARWLVPLLALGFVGLLLGGYARFGHRRGPPASASADNVVASSEPAVSVPAAASEATTDDASAPASTAAQANFVAPTAMPPKEPTKPAASGRPVGAAVAPPTTPVRRGLPGDRR